MFYGAKGNNYRPFRWILLRTIRRIMKEPRVTSNGKIVGWLLVFYPQRPYDMPCALRIHNYDLRNEYKSGVENQFMKFYYKISSREKRDIQRWEWLSWIDQWMMKGGKNNNWYLNVPSRWREMIQDYTR